MSATVKLANENYEPHAICKLAQEVDESASESTSLRGQPTAVSPLMEASRRKLVTRSSPRRVELGTLWSVSRH